MKKFSISNKIKYSTFIGVLFFSFSLFSQVNFKEFKGKVVDYKKNRGLESVSITITNTNISTVTNSEGDFILKVPEQHLNATLTVSLLGFFTNKVDISTLNTEDARIVLKEAVTNLEPVNISTFADAKALVKKVFNNKSKTVPEAQTYMTAFYRETIKKRNRNVSLTEAVVDILKQPFSTPLRDVVVLNKARKKTDYRRLDTLTLKLQGGPFSALFMDIVKYPEYLFDKESIDTYVFNFDEPTVKNGKNVYVVNFVPEDDTYKYNYNGKLFIDVNSLALISADYNLNVSNAKRSKNMLVKKKPRDVEVYPLEANYKVDYKENNGKWYYSYSNLNLKFKVNKKRQWFDKLYTLSSEMAVTDFDPNPLKKRIDVKKRLRPNVIITDAISGFSDPNFWGKYNLIEPDKSIETAINKIQKRLK